MRVSHAAALALALAGLATAQTSPPPLCFELNPLPPTALASVNTSNFDPLVVHFTAPVTSTVDRIELWFPFSFGPPYQSFRLELYPTSALGVPPTPPFLVAFTSPIFIPAFWHPFAVPPGVTSPTLTAGSTWALAIRGLPTVSNQSQSALVCEAVYYDPSATAPLPYTLGSTPACPPQLPASGTIGVPMRFGGTTCGPGPSASVSTLGFSCGYGSGPSAELYAGTPPVLGSLWWLSCSGPAGATAHLFWSGGVNPAGSLIVPGNACLHYLDETSLLSLLSQGAEPIVIATLPSSPPTVTSWTFSLPSFPFYAGLVIGAQAIVVSTIGTIPLGGGLFVQTTNALQIVLGY